MNIAKIVGVMGSGLIGTDPYQENAWSGSSKFLFKECSSRGILHKAFGVEVDRFKKIFLMIKNFSIYRDVWRHNFYLDTKYYELLSRCIVNALTDDDLEYGLLQIGGIYNLKSLLPNNSNVFSYHDGNLAQAIRSPYFSEKISKSKIQKALLYEQQVYEGIDIIFTMSDYLRSSFINDFMIEEEKVKTIGAGINLDIIPHPKLKDYDRKTLVFVGADFYRKGGVNLLHAFKAVREVYSSAILNIIGPKSLKIPSKYSAGVIYHGFLSKNNPYQRQKFEQIMNESTIFVMPSLYEPFGIAPLEAMVYEIPCILTNAWAFPEMVKPGVNGELVRCGDLNELTEKIIYLLRNPNQLQVMGKTGRDLVLKKFTWSNVVSNLIKELSVFGMSGLG